MGIPEEIPFMSVDEYLVGERESDVRHEYVGGTVYAMSGASEAHNLIAGNLFAALHTHLRGGPCRVFMSDMKVRLSIARDDVFYYPDLLVSCDPADADPYFKARPKVIVEVLSASTERVDRREKFLGYQRIPSLEEYVLVDQARVQITVFRRSTDWDPEILEERGAFALRALDFEMTAEALYEGVAIG